MKITILITCMIYISFAMTWNAFSRSNEWKSKTTRDGKITAKYCITDTIDVNGNKVPLIKDSVMTTVNLSMQSCISLMKNIPGHKYFSGYHISEIVSTISDHEWIVYYYSKNPWPIANSDCVAKMIFLEDSTGKMAVFKITAISSDYKKGKVNRMSYYHVNYSFRGPEDGKVEIIISGTSIPPVKVPIWIIKSAFPGVQIKSVKKIVELIKEIS